MTTTELNTNLVGRQSAGSASAEPEVAFGLGLTDIVLLATAFVALWNTAHDTRMLFFMVPLCAAVLLPKTRRMPLVWILAAVSWLPVMIFSWNHMEDHVYLNAYWLLAIGISLRASQHVDAPPLSEQLLFQARYLVGLTFAAATLWKVTSQSFLDGTVFQQVLLFDHRFSWPFAEVFGGISAESLALNQQAADQLRVAGADLAPVALAPGSSMTLIVQLMVIGTICAEAAIAASFLAPNKSLIAKLRHPSLLAFCWMTYPFVPVLGFALLLCTMGAVTARRSGRLRIAYAASALFFMVSLVA